MAGIKHQRDGIGPLLRDLAGELADLVAHLALRQIRCRQHFETGFGQQLRHRLGVVGRVGQSRHRTIGGLTDHERQTAFSQRRTAAQQKCGGDNQVEKRAAIHGANLRQCAAIGLVMPADYRVQPGAVCDAHNTEYSTVKMSQPAVAAAGSRYLGFFAGSAGRATPHGSYFSLGSGMRSSAAL